MAAPRTVHGQSLQRRVAGQLRDAIYRGELAPASGSPASSSYRAPRRLAQHDSARPRRADQRGPDHQQPRPRLFRARARAAALLRRPNRLAERRSRTTRDAFMSDVTEQGRTGDLASRSRSVPRRPRDRGTPGLEDGAAVVVRRRVQYVDGQPYATADTYFPHGPRATRRSPNPTTSPRAPTAARRASATPRSASKTRSPSACPPPTKPPRCRSAPAPPSPASPASATTPTTSPSAYSSTVLPGDRYTLVYDVPGD